MLDQELKRNTKNLIYGALARDFDRSFLLRLYLKFVLQCVVKATIPKVNQFYQKLSPVQQIIDFGYLDSAPDAYFA